MFSNTSATRVSKSGGGRFSSRNVAAAAAGISPRTAREIRDLIQLARLLDNRFEIAGFRFGLDAIIGLVPGMGDVLSALISLYIIQRAKALGAPDRLIGKMRLNVAIDTLIGAVPFLGDLFDAAYKSNLRNVRLLLDHLGVDDNLG